MGRRLPGAHGGVRGAPYDAALRLYWWWRENEADVTGRLAREGASLQGQPAAIALDILYSLWLDDLVPLGETRAQVRERLDEALPRPLDPRRAAEQDAADALASNDPEWGLTPDAVRASEEIDVLFPESE